MPSPLRAGGEQTERSRVGADNNLYEAAAMWVSWTGRRRVTAVGSPADRRPLGVERVLQFRLHPRRGVPVPRVRSTRHARHLPNRGVPRDRRAPWVMTAHALGG